MLDTNTSYESSVIHSEEGGPEDQIGEEPYYVRNGENPEIAVEEALQPSNNITHLEVSGVCLGLVVLGRVEDQQGEYVPQQSYDTERDTAKGIHGLSECEVEHVWCQCDLLDPVRGSALFVVRFVPRSSLIKTDDIKTNKVNLLYAEHNARSRQGSV